MDYAPESQVPRQAARRHPGKSRFCTTISRDPPKGIGSNLGSIGAYLVGTLYRNDVAIAIAKILICAESPTPWLAARWHRGN